ncbi:hypothetical protein U0070_023208, partial [Myodes glareolus]
ERSRRLTQKLKCDGSELVPWQSPFRFSLPVIRSKASDTEDPRILCWRRYAGSLIDHTYAVFIYSGGACLQLGCLCSDLSLGPGWWLDSVSKPSGFCLLKKYSKERVYCLSLSRGTGSAGWPVPRRQHQDQLFLASDAESKLLPCSSTDLDLQSARGKRTITNKFPLYYPGGSCIQQAPPPQMESVGVYGFCGCKGKSKMKCESSREVTTAAKQATRPWCWVPLTAAAHRDDPSAVAGRLGPASESALSSLAGCELNTETRENT